MPENGIRAFQRAKLSSQDMQLNTISSIFLPQIKLNAEKTCLKRPLKKKTKIGFQDQLSLHAGQKYCRMFQGEHSAILLTLIKLPFVIKIVLCLFLSGHLRQVFAVTKNPLLAVSNCTQMHICVHVGTPLGVILS